VSDKKKDEGRRKKEKMNLVRALQKSQPSEPISSPKLNRSTLEQSYILREELGK